MANLTSVQAYNLSIAPQFLNRLSVLLDAEVMAVLRESLGTANHTQRAVLANTILYNPDGLARTFARELVFDTNLIGAALVLDNSTIVDTVATDAAIRSQIATNWNNWCGV